MTPHATTESEIVDIEEIATVQDSAAVRLFDRVHVVTVLYNSASTLDGYIAALEACADRIVGVTMVDNASTDTTLAVAQAAAARSALPIEIIRNANTGFAGGYVAAAASAVERGMPVLCLNPDVMLHPDAVEHLLDVLNSVPDAGVVTTPLVEADGSPDTASRRKLPTLGASMVYSILGRLTPSSIRYNAQLTPTVSAARSAEGVEVTELEATTGALMLVHPAFRQLDDGIFDRDYWMYGEDLQLCADARRASRHVFMAEVAPSVHLKGVSSGRPRSTFANRAFHDAMLDYARKNLVSSPVVLGALRVAIGAHFVLSEARAVPTRLRRARRSAAA
jgi:N-acetylglucosaminyl-diphospho-decaprenol L-rhamnosyltransferase